MCRTIYVGFLCAGQSRGQLLQLWRPSAVICNQIDRPVELSGLRELWPGEVHPCALVENNINTDIYSYGTAPHHLSGPRMG